VNHQEPAPEDAEPAGPTLATVSEDDLLAQVFPRLPLGRSTLLGPGDDAAVVSAPDGRTVISTDVLVEGRHFRLRWSGGADVGWRAATQNLADIAAMGARPTALVVGLVVPADLPVGWVLDLATGLAEACAPLGVGVVGGDLSGGRELVVSVTVLGDLDGRAPVLRSGARPGDLLAHAGVRGHSAAGLALLSAGQQDVDASGVVHTLLRAYRRPAPPVQAGPVAADAGASAMMDVSDGLLRDAGRLARASGVVLDLGELASTFGQDLALLAPVAADLGADARAWVLTGGEDHGLLATFPPGAPVPEPFRVVGSVTGPSDRHVAGTVLVAGVPPEVGSTGWDHFGAQPRR
jgi:thiamine-monophosphate kinase